MFACTSFYSNAKEKVEHRYVVKHPNLERKIIHSTYHYPNRKTTQGKNVFGTSSQTFDAMVRVIIKLQIQLWIID